MNEAHDFLAARDFLWQHRTDLTRARAFEWPRLERFNWALDYFDPMARGNDQSALWIVGEDGSEQRLSFAQMAQGSNRVANLLRDLGVRRGDRMLMILGNELALWETMLAAIKLGAVLIPATSLLTPDDLRDRLDRGQVRHVVVDSAQVPKFAGLPGDFTRICVGPAVAGWHDFADAQTHASDFTADGPTMATDPMLLYFTSGTTSKPKLVLHTHQSYPVGHLSTMYWTGLQRGDIHMTIASPGWAKHAWSCFFAPWNAEACIFIANTARFNAKHLLSTLVDKAVTSFCAPPTVWRLLIQEDLASYRDRLRLRALLGAGEPLNPEILEQVQQGLGLTLRDGYGQTETTCQIGNAPGQKVKPGSMGKPLPGYPIVLLDVDGKPALEGEVCIDLAARPLGLMDRYDGSPERNLESMRDGYYHTGDVAVQDADGYITFVGRSDDVFKSSGYRISPFELESALLEHDAVTEAAVVPSPESVRFEVPKAFVTVGPAFQPDRALAGQLFAFLKDKLAPYKRIRRIEFTNDLPKTISGKIRRVELRSNEAQLRASGERKPLEFFEEDFSQP
ncbi:MAG TPA: AMP-binding protein [Burkholderiaceae bacterium]